MNPILSHALTLAVGGAIGLAFFLLRRFITGGSAQEKVTLYGGLADITTKLRQHGVSLEDVDKLARYLRIKEQQHALAAESARTTLSAPADAGDGEPAQYWTQGAMNARAGAAYAVARAELEAAITNLDPFLDDDERSLLASTQESWEDFREHQIAFAREQYRGGSIAPLIAASEGEAITRERIAWLEAEVADRRRRYG